MEAAEAAMWWREQKDLASPEDYYLGDYLTDIASSISPPFLTSSSLVNYPN